MCTASRRIFDSSDNTRILPFIFHGTNPLVKLYITWSPKQRKDQYWISDKVALIFISGQVLKRYQCYVVELLMIPIRMNIMILCYYYKS